MIPATYRLTRTTPPIDRFWAKTHKAKGCWLWSGKLIGRDKRAVFCVEGKQTYAARFSWELHNNQKIPKGLHVLHTCDNPACVNPSHLFLGTQGDNLRDAWTKGRRKPARNVHPGAKLTEGSVREIRKRYEIDGRTKLAEEFGVAKITIWKVYSRRLWKDVN